MNMIRSAKNQIAELTAAAYRAAVQEGLLPEGVQTIPAVEIPKDTANGDYTTTFALAAAKALGKPPLKPRRSKKADVVSKARKRHKGQRQPLCAEIGPDFVRAARFFTLHRLLHSPMPSENAGSPRGSRSWMLCTACSAQRQRQRQTQRQNGM